MQPTMTDYRSPMLGEQVLDCKGPAPRAWYECILEQPFYSPRPWPEFLFLFFFSSSFQLQGCIPFSPLQNTWRCWRPWRTTTWWPRFTPTWSSSWAQRASRRWSSATRKTSRALLRSAPRLWRPASFLEGKGPPDFVAPFNWCKRSGC